MTDASFHHHYHYDYQVLQYSRRCHRPAYPSRIKFYELYIKACTFPLATFIFFRVHGLEVDTIYCIVSLATSLGTSFQSSIMYGSIRLLQQKTLLRALRVLYTGIYMCSTDQMQGMMNARFQRVRLLHKWKVSTPALNTITCLQR